MRSDMFAYGFRVAKMTVSANLAGVSQEESLRQVVPSGSCVNWLAGHVLTARDGLRAVLGVEGGRTLESGQAAPYRRGSSGVPQDALPIERIAVELEAASEAIIAKLRSMRDEEFDAELDPKMFPFPPEHPTLANFLTVLLFHEAYHSGQLGLARRLLGKPSGIGI